MSIREASGVTQDNITIEREPIMTSVGYALTRMESSTRLAIRSKGNAIPNAVAVANIIRDMKGGDQDSKNHPRHGCCTGNRKNDINS